MPRNTRTIKRARRGAARVEASSLREALRDNRTWTGIGLVFVPAHADKHYEIVTADNGAMDVLVHVQLQPNNEPLFCRLGASAGSGSGTGCWAIPQPGAEVGLVIPHGELEADPMIVCVLSGGDVPEQLDETTLIVKGPSGGKVVVIADTVELGDGSELSLMDGVLTGQTVDITTGFTYGGASQQSSSVRAKGR